MVYKTVNKNYVRNCWCSMKLKNAIDFLDTGISNITVGNRDVRKFSGVYYPTYFNPTR